jgi:hypothetical protein
MTRAAMQRQNPVDRGLIGFEDTGPLYVLINEGLFDISS